MGHIETSMRDYFEAHPDLKYIFFGGKGGVGKTVSAGVTAQWLAGQGKRILLGVPILPPYYSLRLLPFVVPLINNWRRRMLRERDLTDMMF